MLPEERNNKLLKAEIAKIEKILLSTTEGKKPNSLYEPCSYILNGGGKRLRPLLVLIAAKAGGISFKKVYNAAVAVEMLHNFTLVHDDIMDNSDIRRGRETLHKKYDVNTAILAGDNLIALAYRILLKDCKSNPYQVVSSFTKGIIEVCEGQSLDKDFELRENVSLEEYKVMIYKKTAALLEACCAIGMQLANGSAKEINSLSLYGKNIGMAFQVQDDLLDIIGEEEDFGKKIGSDLIEGKKTFLFLSALKKAEGNDLLMLKRVIRDKGIPPRDVDSYKLLYERLGILDQARKEIKSYTKLALKSLGQIQSGEGKQLLTWLANSLINRTK
jgi:geranylgeranyl diphosphate synthase, type II